MVLLELYYTNYQPKEYSSHQYWRKKRRRRPAVLDPGTLLSLQTLLEQSEGRETKVNFVNAAALAVDFTKLDCDDKTLTNSRVLSAFGDLSDPLDSLSSARLRGVLPCENSHFRASYLRNGKWLSPFVIDCFTTLLMALVAQSGTHMFPAYD